ncbi:MAG TPA: fumarylacetoacetate hydrolase family protein [Candidatus Limnocylindrales bacterium]
MELAIRGRDRRPVQIGAIYTIGMNYDDPANPAAPRPERPLVYGKASTALTGDRTTIRWNRALTANVDGECELGVVMADDQHILGYTIVNDVTSQDSWLDGDQWLLGKSFPGFCPVGPWIVPADELDVADLALSFTVNGVAVQGGRTSQMRFDVHQIVEYLGQHIALREGDLIATGTPVRIGADAHRHLQAGDTMTCWIEGIGELTNTVE